MKNLNSYFALKIFTFLLLGTATSAAILRPLDETKVVEAVISRQGLTRITVQRDRIVNVFGVSNECVLEADEDQGQVFIRPTGPGAFKPIYLTLTTEKGHTQDLRLIPKDQPPEALILQENEDLKAELLKEKRQQILLTRDEIENLFQACQEERIPLGYKIVPLELTTLAYSKGTPLGSCPLLIREIKGERLRALTYEIKNTSKTPLVLSPQDFSKTVHAKESDLIAILMIKKTINPGEGTRVYVIAKSQ